MNTWYACKVKHSRQTEDGTLKSVTDSFLVDAVSYTDAEKRIYAAMEVDAQGEFSVANISKTNLSEVINFDDADFWYKCKVTYITVDGDAGKELKVNTYFLVSAENLKQAYERVEDSLNSMLVPFDIPSITKTNFYDVYPYSEEEKENEEIPDNLTPVSEVEEEPELYTDGFGEGEEDEEEEEINA